MGDLKDQLGIKHRKPKNNRDTSPTNLEAAPMFQEQHSRSTSELSTHNAYEPTAPLTPLSRGGELSPPTEHFTLPSRKQSDPSSLLAPPSPGHFDAPSPSPSYYSASDIPPPSPQPPTQFRLASGEITTIPLLVQTSPGLLQSPASQGPSGLMRRLSGSGGSGKGSGKDEGMYEMRVRSPPHDHAGPAQYGHNYGGSEGAASYTSYATAADELWAGEDEYDVISSYSVPGTPHAQNHERSSEETTKAGDDGRIAVSGVGVGQKHDRRSSALNTGTWEVGRAV